MVSVIGELIGERPASDPDGRGEVVIRVTPHGGPDGPARNSFILVDLDHDGMPRARYLSWIGYPDLDEVSDFEFGRWRLVEPPQSTAIDVDWRPFGWGPMEVVWTRPLIPFPSDCRHRPPASCRD